MSVYVLPTSPAVKRFALFDWGAASAVLLAPLSLLPSGVASPIFVVACVLAVLVSLRILGVRDWRVYCIVLTWPFVALGWLFGNIELPMTLALALAWRYRDRPGVAGFLVALLISVKFIVWPIALWLLATRRFAAATYALAWAVGINLAAWAIVGFGQIPRYIALLPAVAKVARPRGSGVVSLAVHLGASSTTSYAIAIAITFVLAGGCLLAARRGDELCAFSLAIVSCLVATPIVDPYYYTLLVVPLAIARPRFGAIWAVPLVLWLSLLTFGAWGQIGTTAVCLCMTAGLVVLVWPRRRRHAAVSDGGYATIGLVAPAPPPVT